MVTTASEPNAINIFDNAGAASGTIMAAAAATASVRAIYDLWMSAAPGC